MGLTDGIADGIADGIVLVFAVTSQYHTRLYERSSRAGGRLCTNRHPLGELSGSAPSRRTPWCRIMRRC